MKRVVYIILLLLLVCGFVTAQCNVFEVGARVGGDSYYIKATDVNLKRGFGIQTMLDVSYSYLGEMDEYAKLGFKIGASVGWSKSYFESKYKNQFVNYDYLGKRMNYTIQTDNVVQSIEQIQAEVPIMLAFRYAGVGVNMGIKGMMPFNATYTQNLYGLNISAYYPEYDVTITNELITGLATEDQFNMTGKMNVPLVNLLASLEFGYEFAFGRGDKHAIGVMAYVDYCFWNNYSGKKRNTEDMITVSSIANSTNPVPTVNVGVLSASSITAMNYFDIGVKTYYRFQAGATGYGGRGRNRSRSYSHGHR